MIHDGSLMVELSSGRPVLWWASDDRDPTERGAKTVAVVGDGAVGLSAVLAAKRVRAERIMALSRHADRQTLAQAFGATDIVAGRGVDERRAIKSLVRVGSI
jgi:Zn-dependent alcohol dehydrogenase